MSLSEIPSLRSNETLLHNKIKSIYDKNENVKTEVTQKVNGKNFRFDLLDDDKTIIYEIQRASFGGRFSRKIQTLLESTKYRIRIIHPIVHKQKITRLNGNDHISTSYRNFYSTEYNFFDQLVYFKVKYQDRLEFDILVIYEHLIKQFAGYYQRSGRRRFQTLNRDLVRVDSMSKIRTKQDFYNFLPEELPSCFTNQDLQNSLKFKKQSPRSGRLPGKITYSMCQLGLLERIGKKRNAHVFTRQH
ncbi:MAG: hypothetical protein ACW97Z_02695 [Candidatus Hodarchaeales archaeon]|jgi:hypothetical protein